jgi:hypothetical protein
MVKAKKKPLRSDTSWRTRPLGDELGEALRAELLGWPEMMIRPMMGTISYFRGKRFLGCYVNRELVKSKPDWVNRAGEPTYVCVRLRADDAARAFTRPGLSQSRLGFAGWVEIPLASRKLLLEAVKWFGRAYENPAATREKKPRRARRQV